MQDVREIIKEKGQWKGRKEGIKEGRQEERQQVVLNMLEKKWMCLAILLFSFSCLYFLKHHTFANAYAESVLKEDLCEVEWWKKATPEMLLQASGSRKLETLYCESKNSPLLHKAVSWGRPETVKVFLEKGGKNLINSSLHGWTPLRMALQYQADDNVIPVVRLLVQYGANLNYTPFGSIVDSRLGPCAGHSVWYETLSRWSRKKLSLRIKIVDLLIECRS